MRDKLLVGRHGLNLNKALKLQFYVAFGQINEKELGMLNGLIGLIV